MDEVLRGDAAHREAGADLCVDALVAGAARLADRPLTYRVPVSLRPFAAVGVRAVLPLGVRRVLAFVLAVRPCSPEADGARVMRDVIDLPDDTPMFSEALLALAREVASETLSSLRDAVASLVPPEVFREPVRPRPQRVVLNSVRPAQLRLGRRQAAMLAAVSGASGGVPASELTRAGGRPVLRRLAAAGLVTIHEPPRPPVAGGPAQAVQTRAQNGSREPTLLVGDLEARLRWIEGAVAAAVRGGGRALVIVPEIADVPPALESLRNVGAVDVLHSDLAPRARRAVWARVRDGLVDVVVGTRSALFAPLPNLRLLVVDDEQAESYKSDSTPRYHARDVAARRARLEGARLVLGSAAPSVETYAAGAAGALTVVRLPRRRPLPAVTVVDMRAERRLGRAGYLSRTLVQAITRHLRARGRVALLVPQMGYARVLLCRECGAAVRCPACDLAMAYDREGGTVHCRVCGRSTRAPDVCPHCGGVDLRGVGAGTKRVEEIVRRLFPALRIARLDAETAPAAARLARDFAGGRVRLLVGTVRLLRVLRSARPTLVGAVDADGPMYLPDFRAAEHTLQRLRAAAETAAVPPTQGPRPEPAPEVVLQTRVPDHPVMRAMATGSDAAFYDAELKARREFGYPPYARLVRVVAEAATPDAARALAGRLAAAARAHGLDVLGPAALRGAGAGGTRVQCVLRAADPEAALDGARAALAEVAPPGGARFLVDVDPQVMV